MTYLPRSLVLAAAVLTSLVACHTLTEPAQVGSISLDPSGGTVSMGGTIHLVATVRDVNGAVLTNPLVMFQSSAPLIATVDSAGVVSGLLVGLVTITATSGDRTATAALQVSPAASTALALGNHSACELTETGAAYCWGGNEAGQLGDNTTIATNVPVAVSGGLTFTAIASSTDAVCGIVVDGATYCWGANLNGQLGDGSRVDSHLPVPVSGGLRFDQVTAGAGFACGLTVGRAAYCWGANDNGRLGNGTLTPSLIPVAVLPAPAPFRSLSAGLLHACGLTASNIAYCWGGNAFSQLGDGTSTSRPSPGPVGGGLQFTSLHPGATTTCGIAVGVAYCWGSDIFGSLGQGTTTDRPDAKLPVPLVGGISFLDVRAGAGNHIFTPGCGVALNGAAYCWGANSNGQLGTDGAPDSCNGFNMTFGCTGIPVAVVGGHAFQVVIPGAGFVCGITIKHAVLCWGANAMGELGNGTNEDSGVPVAVLGGLRTP